MAKTDDDLIVYGDWIIGPHDFKSRTRCYWLRGLSYVPSKARAHIVGDASTTLCLAKSQIDSFETYFHNDREKFMRDHPELVERVIYTEDGITYMDHRLKRK